ncbi:hypothetical protein D3C87_2102460 [compost metagenome]
MLIKIPPDQFVQESVAVPAGLACELAYAHGAKTQVNANAAGSFLGGEITLLCIIIEQNVIDMAGREFIIDFFKPHIFQCR